MAKYFLCGQCDNLMINVMSCMSGEIKRRAVWAMVMEYCGRNKETQRKLRERLSMSYRSIDAIRDTVYKRMDDIQHRACAMIDAVLIEAEIVRK